MVKRWGYYLLNSMFCLLYRKEYKRFISIEDIETTQRQKLFNILHSNKASKYGIKYAFENINSITEYQKNVPITDYEDYQEYIEEIKAGKPNVLTEDQVLVLELSSGSTAASKLIPYTASLKAEFQNGIKPWIYDLYTTNKGIRWGKSYWSITPVMNKKEYTKGGISIGFEDDKEYFGSLEGKILDLIFAVPGYVAKIPDIEDFYFKTSLELLKCKDLSLISIWNPSFLFLLLEYMQKNSRRLIGEINKNDKRRAEELTTFLAENDFAGIWPKLKVISCWGDASSSRYQEKLKRIFPDTTIQPKGLIATEGFISLPMSSTNGSVLSVKSHFFEFESMKDKKIYLAHELENGEEYTVILTTSGGFYRYRLNDVIKVVGYYKKAQIPVIKFIGKNDKVADLFGEKINEKFVVSTLDKLGLNQGYTMLAPQIDRYVLYTNQIIIKDDEKKLDRALMANFHYEYCRKLGQLKPLRIFKLNGNPEEEYLNECVSKGQRLGDIKPTILHLKDGWDKIFKGDYI